MIFASSATYTYDAAGRILTVQYDDGQSLTYTYDNVGNRTEQVAVGSGGGSERASQSKLASSDKVEVYAVVN